MADEFEQYRVDEPSGAASVTPPNDEFEQYRVHDEEPKETLGQSAALAIPRIATDVSNKFYNAVQSIPGYWEKLKTEAPGLLFNRHPLHALGQGVAGANEAINSLAQFPLDVSRYGSDRLHLLPEAVTNAIQKITPEDTSAAINELFGAPKYSGEAALRGTARNALPIAGVARFLQAIPHLTKYGATQHLKAARGLAEERNIGPLNVDPQLIEDAKQFLPNTLPYRNALNAAHYGDYNNLFKLQSDVGKNASDYARSLFSAAERSHGRAGLEARNRLLDAIHENLQIQGHNDISDLLRQGQLDYKRHMAFRPWRNALLAAGALSALPKGMITSTAKKIWQLL